MITREQLREAKRLRRESEAQQQKAHAPKSTSRPEPPGATSTPSAPQIVTPPKKVAPLKPPEAPVPEVETVDYSSMTKSQLQDLLKERGVAYLPRSTNRILIGLLENV